MIKGTNETLMKMPSISYQLHAIEAAKRNIYTDNDLWSDKVKEKAV